MCTKVYEDLWMLNMGYFTIRLLFFFESKTDAH